MKDVWNSLRPEVTAIAKKVLYRFGLLGIYHRLRNRRLLTVVIFHRVLPKTDLRASGADPEWTVSDVFFEDCLQFFVKHYNAVSSTNVLEFVEGIRPLPTCPLLITIDDGWSDTEEHAANLLRQMKLPAVVFVVSDAVGGRELWQETVRRIWRSESLRRPMLELIFASTGVRHDALPPVIDALSVLSPARRNTIIERMQQSLDCSKLDEMLSLNQVKNLQGRGYTIGSHGVTHTSITLAADPWNELYESRRTLAGILGENDDSGPVALSFPNGRYNSDVLRMAKTAGYSCLFTSDSHLNSFTEGISTPVVLGRINISSQRHSDNAGRLCPELLAASLFLRPVVPVRCAE